MLGLMLNRVSKRAAGVVLADTSEILLDIGSVHICHAFY